MQLESLNLSSFSTSKVINMNMMFSGCVNLKYINFSNYENMLNITTSKIFYRTHKNLIIYIDNINHDNIINLIPELSSMNCITNDFSINSKNIYKVINDNRICLKECYKDNFYKYEYNFFCYSECPKRTSSSLSNKYFCELVLVDCIEEYPFLVMQDYYCTDDCNSEDFFNKICTINILNIKSQSTLIKNIINGIEDGSMDKLLLSNINENKDIIKIENNILYQITSSFNQRNIKYNNISTIDLLECESIIKTKYDILPNETLLIFKMESYIEGLLIPFIEYEFFHPTTKKRLNLNECEDLKIHVNIPVSINESILYKYDLNDSYYKDICNIVIEEENGVDITLYDRKNNYIKNNMYLCTRDCVYLNYNKEQKKAACLCKVHSGMTLFKDINKEQLIDSVINIKRKTNLNIIKCYKLVFSEQGIIKNIGNYIIAFISLFYIFSAIFFYFKDLI
jgi:surface protein